ncbi:phosphatase PAP2/dual specificity phosphatase family protein [Luteolibacter flavescens]|uniref:Phosphatase PAP2/dual specificity phosphatase family protein n=1 Tax=Luteolibacter flavescens TaxID=1859460 RepID=A0ABT3FM59_9BACT|nr:phosphatase PAP2/dual specificity phosphatase family protein [Luteolibacter flavescens]MCW1884664.1 phosphatase PAP2/dual specificity phosphatase family protein [Luteolibacter flavescens]
MNRTPREPGLLWPALWRLAVAGAAFVLIYGFCNRYTSTRDDVGTWFWEWERHIPFVKEMVVPYWSLDLFFIGAFFLCSSKAELNLLTKRLVAVTIASGICFLLFPLEMGFPRPEPSGWTAPLFKVLYANDMPYNLAPSLHISLRSLVWTVYGAHLTGLTRKVTKAWFFLIGLSTLLVWQHHVIDVAAGFMMGWFIAALIPDPRFKTKRTPSPRLALRYGAGALACAGLAFLWFGFAWPAVALGIVSLAYATGLPRLLGKENGTLSPAAEWCLLPVIVVTHLYQRRWLRREPAWCEVSPGVLVGRKLTGKEARTLVAGGPLAVLDLTAESYAPTVFREHANYRSLPLLDLVKPHDADLTKAVDFIREQQPHRTVYIHCQLGLQRSALVAALWLEKSGIAGDREQAAAMVRERIPGAVL